MDALIGGIASRGGGDITTATHKAVAALSGQLTRDAFVSAFDDASLVLAAVIAVNALLLPFFSYRRRVRAGATPAAE